MSWTCIAMSYTKNSVFLSDSYTFLTFLSDWHTFWSDSQESTTRYGDAMQNGKHLFSNLIIVNKINKLFTVAKWLARLTDKQEVSHSSLALTSEVNLREYIYHVCLSQV